MIKPAAKNVEDFYPLSPLQQGMLFHSLAEPGSGVYVVQLTRRLRGALDSEAFARAWQSAVDRHAILRTSFTGEGLKTPVQVVHRKVEIKIDQKDWRSKPADQRDHDLDGFLQSDLQQGFDLARPPLMRLSLIREDDESNFFLWSFHHILLDGWASALVLQDVFATYDAFRHGSAPKFAEPRPYRDYISWLHRSDKETARAFWRKSLAGIVAPTPFGVDQTPRRASPQPEARNQWVQLSDETSQKLRSLAQTRRVTLSTVMQAAWALILARYSGEQDVLYGVTVSGRPPELSGVESMIGLFINTLPARIHVPSNLSFADWLPAVQRQQLEMQQFEYCHLIEIQGWSEVPRGLPLFESLLVYENYPVNGAIAARDLGLEVTSASVVEGGTGYPLSVFVAPGARIAFQLRFQPQRFQPGMIDNMQEHWQTLLENIARQPELPVCELSFASRGDQQKLLVEWNDTGRPVAQDRCYHELFEAQVDRTPDAVALVCHEQQLTYRELNTRANQLAYDLIARGAGPETLIGLCTARSAEMVIGLLGILKAGSAYVPLDPGYPRDRIEYVLADSGATLLLTHSAVVQQLWNENGNVNSLNLKPEVVLLDEVLPKLTKSSTTNPVVQVHAENLAYAIYTSGSTGKPKGVAIPHGALVNFLESMAVNPGFTAGDVLLAVTTISFDIAGLELYLPLLAGGRLVLAPEEATADSERLAHALADHRVSVMQATPATWRMLIESGWRADEQNQPSSSRDAGGLKALCGGEAMPWDLAAALLERGIELWNMYGPTETTIWSTIEQITGADEITIGRPISNTQAFIHDLHGQLAPVRVRGELYLGGLGLARGYLYRPDLTADRFVPNPNSGSEPASHASRLYRTGDVARYLEDGRIECFGRVDHQVKIRGFRIELGEIEAVCSQHPAVDRVAVVAREEVPGEKYLAAYIVAGTGQPPTVSDMRQMLTQQLPHYMLPQAFEFLDELPLTPNGKVDRGALPAPSSARPELESDFVAPQSEIERKIAGIWVELLNVEHVGIEDNFFDLGGHSLLLMRLQNRLNKNFDRKVSIVDLFRLPTISALSRFYTSRNGDQQQLETARNAAGRQRAALQQRMAAMKKMKQNKI